MKDYLEAVYERGWHSLGHRFVCASCFASESLRRQVDESASESSCDYCGRANPSVAIDQIMEVIGDAIRSEYGDPNDVGVPYESAEGGYQAGLLDAREVLEDLGWPFENDELADEVVAAFGDTAWVSRHLYVPSRSEALMWGWTEFVQYVSTESRFFFAIAPDRGSYRGYGEIPPSEILDHIFDNVLDAGLIRTLEVGTSVVRARVHSNDVEIDRATELGTPPTEKATFSSRMSPAGIPMFYGAFDPDTAKAEVLGALTGSNRADAAITSGEFSTLILMTVVDLTDLPTVPSVFDDPSRSDARHRNIFLRGFADSVSKPVHLDEIERLEYVPTQIVTEYVRRVLPLRVGRQLDGVVYRSSQLEGGLCIVLFVLNYECVDNGGEDNDGRLALDRSTLTTVPLGPETPT